MLPEQGDAPEGLYARTGIYQGIDSQQSSPNPSHKKGNAPYIEGSISSYK
jgi:hypothetical protein